MGFQRDEEQTVQSGTWDGDGVIPALASPAGGPARVGSKEKESAPGATDAALNNSLAQ